MSKTRRPSRDNNGIPFCSYEECPQYDGKRCRETGVRAGSICEPEVIDIIRDRDTARARLAEVEPIIAALSECDWEDDMIQRVKLYRDEAPALFSDGDGSAIYVTTALARVATKGTP